MIEHRPFKDYDFYVHQQGAKARYASAKLLKHLDRNIASYARLFTAAAPYLKKGPVLCLGARTGAESQGAENAGHKGSIGIDLHPLGPSVLRGDWHALTFPTGSFDNAYTNSLDHCLSLEKMALEVKRVLKPGGRFYVMATNRSKTIEAWRAQGGNEALYWATSEELQDAICAFGFTPVKVWHEGKWGHHILAT